MSLLIAWRLLPSGEGQLGAGLLYRLLGVKRATAKRNLGSLAKRGYLASDGKFLQGQKRRAQRRLTSLIDWPKMGASTYTHRSADGCAPVPVDGCADRHIDLGVKTKGRRAARETAAAGPFNMVPGEMEAKRQAERAAQAERADNARIWDSLSKPEHERRIAEARRLLPKAGPAAQRAAAIAKLLKERAGAP